MELETLKKELFTHVDESIKESIEELAGPALSAKVAEMVKEARALDARDGRTSLDTQAKEAFVEDIKRIAANEKAAYLTVNDQTGGYLVPTEVHNEIMRIAATSGFVARDARRFGVSDIEIPRYTGPELEGQYVGEDQAGSETQEDIGIARLRSAQWMNIIRLSNRLIAKANVNVSEWLMALVAEGLAVKLDRVGLVGGGPFVGLLGSTDVATQTMGTGLNAFDKFTVDEASIAIGSVPTAALGNAAFYMHRSVWARVRTQKNGSEYVFQLNNSNLASLRRESGIQPVGEILGYPVYTPDVMPAFTDSAVSTRFALFANLNLALAIGEDGPMSVARSDSAVINGRSTFERNQTAMRFTHDHSVAVMLPGAAVAIRTSA